VKYLAGILGSIVASAIMLAFLAVMVLGTFAIVNLVVYFCHRGD
jgi:hypothetical protein